MDAVINVPICELTSRPEPCCPRADEALLGWPAEVLDFPNPGWVRLRTHYRYEGYVRAEEVATGARAARWAALPKRLVLQAAADVLSGPAVECWPVTTLVRGCLVSPVGEPDAGGWQRVRLPDGRSGYTKSDYLGTYYENPPVLPEVELRRRIADGALGYLGVQYRWGGKTPLGLDCSGLTAMAYLLQGILIYRDARIEEGFPIHAIDRARMDVADLLYFPGHVALYLGEGRYVHATALSGRVVINSLDPSARDYRESLAQELLAVGSWF